MASNFQCVFFLLLLRRSTYKSNDDDNNIEAARHIQEYLKHKKRCNQMTTFIWMSFGVCAALGTAGWNVGWKKVFYSQYAYFGRILPAKYTKDDSAIGTITQYTRRMSNNGIFFSRFIPNVPEHQRQTYFAYIVAHTSRELWNVFGGRQKQKRMRQTLKRKERENLDFSS